MPVTPATGSPAAFESFACLELMGHRRRFGFVTDVEMFGARMCKIDVHEGDKVVATEFYGAASIYALRVMTREAVVDATMPYRQLPPGSSGAPTHEPDDEFCPCDMCEESRHG